MSLIQAEKQEVIIRRDSLDLMVTVLMEVHTIAQCVRVWIVNASGERGPFMLLWIIFCCGFTSQF